MDAVLAQVHKATASVAENDDLDLDSALATCVRLGLAGPHLAPPEPAARPPLTESAFGMHLWWPVDRGWPAGWPGDSQPRRSRSNPADWLR